eukprot:EG_transcript_23879
MLAWSLPLLLLCLWPLPEAHTERVNIDSMGAVYPDDAARPLVPRVQLTASTVLPAPLPVVWDVVRDLQTLLSTVTPAGVDVHWINVEGGESSRIGAHVAYDLGFGRVLSEVAGIDEEKHVIAYHTYGPSAPAANVLMRLQLYAITDDLGSCFLHLTQTFDVTGAAEEALGARRRAAEQELSNLKELFSTGRHAPHPLVPRDAAKEI